MKTVTYARPYDGGLPEDDVILFLIVGRLEDEIVEAYVEMEGVFETQECTGAIFGDTHFVDDFREDMDIFGIDRYESSPLGGLDNMRKKYLGESVDRGRFLGGGVIEMGPV